MRRILTVIILLLAGLAAPGETVKGLAKPTGYVSDYARVLSDDEKATIEHQCTVLHQETGTQVAVVTIHRLEGATAQEFAHGISDAWGVGSKATDKGIVLLIATEDRKRWIDVGYGLEGSLNDAKVGDIGRAMVPDLKEGRYGQGIKLGVALLSDAILKDPTRAVGFTPVTDQEDHTGLVVVALIFGALVVLVAGLIVFGRRRRGAWGEPGLSIAEPDPPSQVAFVSSTDDSVSAPSYAAPTPDPSPSSGSDFSGFGGGSSGGGGAGGDF